jgi:hypothetical protein
MVCGNPLANGIPQGLKPFLQGTQEAKEAKEAKETKEAKEAKAKALAYLDAENNARSRDKARGHERAGRQSVQAVTASRTRTGVSQL